MKKLQYSLLIAFSLTGDVNGDNMDDLVCVYSTGGVYVALARMNENGMLEFVAEAWKNDDFDFCSSSDSKVIVFFIQFFIQICPGIPSKSNTFSYLFI